MRDFDTPKSKKRRKTVKVTPGKSLEKKDFDESEPDEKEGQVTATVNLTKPGPSNGQRKSKTSLFKEQKNKRRKPFKRSSSEDNSSNYSIQDSDKEFRLSTTSEEEPDFEVPSSPQLTSEFAPGHFLVVKVFGKKSFRLYVV